METFLSAMRFASGLRAPRPTSPGARCLLVALTAALVAAAPLAARQTGQIAGTVTSAATGQALAEVRISVEGTDIRQITDAQGRFFLQNVPAGTQTVTATRIGYGQQRQQFGMSAGGTTTLDFRLSTLVVALEGIVVTGTAIAAQRREIGNSISLITSEDIELSGAVDLDDILRGKAPGLSIQGQTAVPGAGSQILIRGISSIEGRNRPLIYLDGIRINDRGAYETGGSTGGQSASILNSIDPQDIERVEIIKGAAASTLYGTEASAGVIQIFTKRGSRGAPRWTFSVQQVLAVPGHVGPKSDPTGLHLNDCSIGGPLRPMQTAPDAGCPASVCFRIEAVWE